MATTFRGFAGLAAMMFSASLPGNWLTSKFRGTGVTTRGLARPPG